MTSTIHNEVLMQLDYNAAYYRLYRELLKAGNPGVYAIRLLSEAGLQCPRLTP